MLKENNHISFSESPFFNWSKKLSGKIILHSCFWFLYLLYLFSEYLGSLEQDCGINCYLMKNLVHLICTITGVYLNIYFFIPILLYRRKFIKYILSYIAIAIITGSVKLYVIKDDLNINEFQNVGIWSIILICFCRDMFEISAISSIKIANDWITSATLLRNKEKEELEAEFRFLKTQINPHFIFNTLNNIYFLINKNTAKAGETILSLSNILRYRIYDPGEIGNTIENELQCIIDLIELEKLRLDPNVKIDIEIEEISTNFLIEPLLFIPFVENTFKHCRANNNGKSIKITFKLENESVEFSCINSQSKTKENNITEHGIGIKNVRSRLNLIYPNKHNLIINDTLETYEVNLTINTK